MSINILNNPIIYTFVFLFSISLASFFKLMIDRHETNLSIISKASHCENCKKELLWWNNIPIISYLILRGRCYFCNAKIDFSYFFIESLVGIASLIMFINAVNNNYSISYLLLFMYFVYVLILLSVFDYKHQVVPHHITYFSILIVLLFKCIIHSDFKDSIISVGLAFFLMDIFYFLSTIFKRFELEKNYISIPLIIWTFIFLLWGNTLFVFVPILVYFLLFFIKELRIKVSILWSILLFMFLAMFIIYSFITYDVFRLYDYFLGVGLIYLICEVIFYFASFFFPGFNIEEQDAPSQITIGGGDITIIALISSFLGFKVAFLTLFIASFLAILSHILCKLLQKCLKNSLAKTSDYVPMVPYLVVVCFIIILKNG